MNGQHLPQRTTPRAPTTASRPGEWFRPLSEGGDQPWRAGRGSSMRVIKGIAALLVLAVGLVGVPAFLVIFIGNPLPPSWAGIPGRADPPDDGTILIGLITIVAWLAWLVFAFSVAAEVVGVLSRQRVRISCPDSLSRSGWRRDWCWLSSRSRWSRPRPFRRTRLSAPRGTGHGRPRRGGRRAGGGASRRVGSGRTRTPSCIRGLRTAQSLHGAAGRRPVVAGRALLRRRTRLASDRCGQPRPTDRRTRPPPGGVAAAHSGRRHRRRADGRSAG